MLDDDHFAIEQLLFSFDYNPALRDKYKATSHIYKDIINGKFYPPNTFKSIFGNTAMAVRYMPVAIPIHTHRYIKSILL